jgi:hypothetical protein
MRILDGDGARLTPRIATGTAKRAVLIGDKYSVPVTFLQVPGSSPVTLLERPTSLPVMRLPWLVGLTPTLATPGTCSAWQNSRKMSAPMYSVPVTGRQVLGSSPVVLTLRPTLVPVTRCPIAVSVTPTFQG